MEAPDYNSPQALKLFLEEHGMAMQKKFGQNFMVSPSARKRIISLLSINHNDEIWEIGSGLGCMTQELLKNNAIVRAFEIDKGFISILTEIFAQYIKDNQFFVIQGDVLKNWKKETLKKGSDFRGEEIKLFGNLPYNIAASFIAQTISDNFMFDKCVFTVQKEVAHRMVAKPNSKDYSVFSVLCQKNYNVKLGFELAAGNFWPRPNVASQVVILDALAKDKILDCGDTATFVKVVHTLFSQRRKTIYNNLKSLMPENYDAEDFLKSLGISPLLRAENLSVEQFCALSQKYSSVILKGKL